ncbi:MAG: hypothetical protein GXY74_15945 [Phycisphaerae bacterium]|nr:hypothetical protein [Phycisphaerae bacterium]
MNAVRAGQILRRAARRLRRLHGNQRGDMFEYLLVLGAFAIPLFALAQVLLNVMKDRYAMTAFHVGWPFL